MTLWNLLYNTTGTDGLSRLDLEPMDTAASTQQRYVRLNLGDVTVRYPRLSSELE